MTTALIWIVTTAACALHLMCTRSAVRLACPKADNAFDNALGYLAVSTFVYWPIKWVWSAQLWWLLIIGGPPLVISVHLLALETIYQVSRKRAALLGLVQSVLLAISLVVVGVVLAAVVAYILYGKIISDPIWLLKLLLRLIGIIPG